MLNIFLRKFNNLSFINLLIVILFSIPLYVQINQYLQLGEGDLHNYYDIYISNNSSYFENNFLFEEYIKISNVIYLNFGFEVLIIRDILSLLIISYIIAKIYNIKLWSLGLILIFLTSRNTLIHFISAQRELLSLLLLFIGLSIKYKPQKITLILLSLLLHVSSIFIVSIVILNRTLILKKKSILIIYLLPVILLMLYLMQTFPELFYFFFDRLDHYTENSEADNIFNKIITCIVIIFYLKVMIKLGIDKFKYSFIFILNLISLSLLFAIPSVGDRLFQISLFIFLFVIPSSIYFMILSKYSIVRFLFKK